MNAQAGHRVSYDLGCMRSLKKLPDKVSAKFLDMMMRYMSDPSGNGLNFETIEGSRDRGVKSIRIDQSYRAIAFVSGQDIMFLHVNEHDKAYRWAEGRRVRVDTATNRIRIVEEVDTETAPASTKHGIHTAETPALFAGISDDRLLSLGVIADELPKVRQLRDQADLDTEEDAFDTTTFDILIALAAGYSDQEIRAIIGATRPQEEDIPAKAEATFSAIVASDESRQRIFIPENEDELRRFFEGNLEGWRVFLHRDQRRVAYRDYNGPALVRGGAGTGKTVVAMHRAKHLADQMTSDPVRSEDRILFTTFTTSLAYDIEANLKTLCPEHLARSNPRIEVINLDRWVSGFLKRKKFERDIAYFGEERERLDTIWREVFDEHGVPDGLSEEFVRAEWEQVIQAKGIMTDRTYFKVPRTGRGTALDRRSRSALWTIFSDYRARMVDAGLAEPDDAYREAVEILQSEAPSLPYSSVIVDEAQDMGEQAFRLIRAIVPEKLDGDRNSIFIVGDAHQRIYTRRASMAACGINVRGRSKQLRLNYRTSDEIRKWAVSILEGVSVDDLDDGMDSLSGYTSVFRGPPPELASYAGEDEEIAGLAAWLSALKTQGTKLEDVGVLASTRLQLDRLAIKLKDAGIETVRLQPNMADERNLPGVRLTTMHRAKGLEFQAVAIPFLAKSTFPTPAALRSAVDEVDRRNILQQQKSLLHVAATRAKKVLRVSWSGEPSVFLTDVTSISTTSSEKGTKRS
jgi:superfamily I DNA/RNA helicase